MVDRRSGFVLEMIRQRKFSVFLLVVKSRSLVCGLLHRVPLLGLFYFFGKLVSKSEYRLSVFELRWIYGSRSRDHSFRTSTIFDYHF